MSELMKSLADSEQRYRMIHTASPEVSNKTYVPKRKSNVMLMIALVVLPPITSIGYIGYNAKQSWQHQTELAMLAIERQRELQNVPKSPLVKFLVYPEISDLKTIDRSTVNTSTTEIESRLVVETVNRDIVETKSETEPLSDDLQLGSLDLSGLSSELAERVQDALDGEDATKSERERYSDDEVERIKLVNYEYVFKGKLPAMNLQTHMYASNEQSRWVKINGVERHEGDWVDDSVQLLTITPRYITVGFSGDVIEIPALYEWEG